MVCLPSKENIFMTEQNLLMTMFMKKADKNNFALSSACSNHLWPVLLIELYYGEFPLRSVHNDKGSVS